MVGGVNAGRSLMGVASPRQGSRVTTIVSPQSSAARDGCHVPDAAFLDGTLREKRFELQYFGQALD